MNNGGVVGPLRGRGPQRNRSRGGNKTPYSRPKLVSPGITEQLNKFTSALGGVNFTRDLEGLKGVTFTSPTGQLRPRFMGRPITKDVLQALFERTFPAENWKTVWGAKLAERAQRKIGNKWTTNAVLTKLPTNNKLRPYFNSKNSARTALNSLFGKATSIMPSGLFNSPTGNNAIDEDRARALLGAARLDYDVTHSTPIYLQAHLGDYLETLSFTIAAAASPSTIPVFWKKPAGAPLYGLNADLTWAPMVQYFAPNWPYDFTVILESEVPFDITIKTFNKNTLNANKKLFVNILKAESNPASHGRPIINWQPLTPSPYKGWWFGKPDAVIVCREIRNGVMYWVIKILELKIGLGKAESVAAEMFQLFKIMKSLEMLLAEMRRRGLAVPAADKIEIKGYFVPWFYGVMLKNKAPAFATINATTTGAFYATYRQFIGQYPNFNIEIVRDGTVFEREFGMNQTSITATLDARSAWWFRKQGELMRNLTGHALGTSMNQNKLETIKNAARLRLALDPTNRNALALKQWLQTVRGLVLPGTRWAKARKYNVMATKPASRIKSEFKHKNYGALETGLFVDPRKAELGAVAVRRAARAARKKGVPLPANYPQIENNGNNGSGSNTGSLRVAARLGFKTLLTPQQIANSIASSKNFNALRTSKAYLGTVNMSQANRNALEKQINFKRVEFAAAAAAAHPGNNRFRTAYELAARKAGINIQTQQPNEQIGNLEAQLRALQQAGRA